ncbi:hypothetical protein GMOD_00004001 [Pyrenophora seminiperda CCB06]|uniref:Secreted protein n=1 Tax=Pyrenophora seminiperda CCB06 TaxID=1302712 RepID=A0A3M7M0F9_9PLEO|nr:hypothetical protein GMOD_00004001 [Pyrenophora seminiperda CCB06]
MYAKLLLTGLCAFFSSSFLPMMRPICKHTRKPTAVSVMSSYARYPSVRRWMMRRMFCCSVTSLAASWTDIDSLRSGWIVPSRFMNSPCRSSREETPGRTIAGTGGSWPKLSSISSTFRIRKLVSCPVVSS